MFHKIIGNCPWQNFHEPIIESTLENYIIWHSSLSGSVKNPGATASGDSDLKNLFSNFDFYMLTDFEIFDNSTAISSAEFPMPRIKTFLSSKP